MYEYVQALQESLKNKNSATMNEQALPQPTPNNNEIQADIPLQPSFILVAESENPLEAYEALANDQEAIDAMQLDAQESVARAGVELDLGLKTKDEREHFEQVFGAYEAFISVAAQHEYKKSIASGTSPERAKKDVIAFLVDSKADITGRDIEHRLEASPIERSKERLARSRTARVVGAVAVLSTLSGAVYLSKNGIETGLAELGVENSPNVLSTSVAIGALALTKTIKNSFEFVGKRLLKGVGGYRRDQSKHESVPAESAQTGESEDVPETRMEQSHMKKVREKLFAVAGENIVGEDCTEEEFIGKLTSIIRESFDVFYGLGEYDESDLISENVRNAVGILTAETVPIPRHFMESGDIAKTVGAVIDMKGGGSRSKKPQSTVLTSRAA